MRIEQDLKLDFDDVLIRPKRSTLRSRREVSLERTYTFPHSEKTWSGIPIIAANMDAVGTFEMSAALKEFGLLTAIHKHYSIEEWKENAHLAFPDNTFLSCGVSEDELQKISIILNEIDNFQFLVIDVANGYGEYLAEFVSKVRSIFPNITIAAGNVVTGDMTEQLLLSGADIVKVGIGSGSACTTRIQTGVGYPQLSAIIECADAAHGLSGRIISDGGCRSAGDIAKAFGAGADFVMLGGMLAGHDESNGEIVSKWYRSNEITKDIDGSSLGHVDEEKKFKLFYGMSSNTAQKKYYGSQKEYRASEGRTVKVEYRGPVKRTIQEILGGLRSACTYVGAPNLKELPKRTTFIKVRKQYNDVYE